jgi:hypothetical protein
MIYVIIFVFLSVSLLSWAWVRGIDNMKENHPDYKGEDFLNWGEDELKSKPKSPEWDDNHVHTEGGFH